MPEGFPQGQRENPELSRLIEELERQIEGVNDGLSKIRGTVARISYAAFGSVTPVSPSSWGSSPVAPANRNEWRTPVVSEPEPEPVPAPEPPAVAPPSPLFAADIAPPLSAHDAAPDAESGFWTSIEEGASWPRAHTEDVAQAADVPHESSWASFGAEEKKPPEEPSRQPGEEPEVPAENVAPVASTQTEWESTNGLGPAEDTKVEKLAGQTAWPETPEKAEPQLAEQVIEPPRVTEVTPVMDETAAVQPDHEVAETSPAPAGEPATSMPPKLSTGWPDESAWSQSFEWPAMKQDEAAEPMQDASVGEHVDVSDIVAQVKAELEAARRGDIPMPLLDSDDEAAARDAAEADQPSSEMPHEIDDEARREEVSRAVAEMRQQIEAGNFEDVMRGRGAGPNHASIDDEEYEAQPSDWERAQPVPDSGDKAREEVRRAVEATRDDLASEETKPAFRLAAPGSLPDWSHMQMEPSGPPVVVMKDVDGRVELASVYETLNELGCGDGAALLNYTPHSVTVGLPASASFPSKEKMAAAVEKVFGLTSRVESDGVRLTVSIGEGPKRRSVDAA